MFQITKRWKSVLSICLALLLSLGLTACGSSRVNPTADSADNAAYHVFYLNQEKTSLVSQGYEPVSDPSDVDAMIGEFLHVLSSDTDSVEYRKVLDDTVGFERYQFENHQLSLYFNVNYADLNTANEVVVRGAVVNTLTQISEVSRISFYVDGKPLKDANGRTVGYMTADSFLVNPTTSDTESEEARLTLYYANEDGTALVKESRNAHYSNRTSLEKVVMNCLLEGPKNEGLQSAIPENTGLISVSVVDALCVVNLDENFLNYNYNIQEDVVIYAIVNSLTDLEQVDKVQIVVNGESNMTYREHSSLQEYYENNQSLVAKE